VLYKAKRRVIRRIMSPDVAATVRTMLREVVEGGTGRHVALTTIDVAGKSGTARRTINGRYVPGAYTGSFVGLFPSDHPQYVILAKIDNPHNGYFGGLVAGGMMNVVLRAAIAARDAALDLHELASSVHSPDSDTPAFDEAIAPAASDTPTTSDTPPTSLHGHGIADSMQLAPSAPVPAATHASDDHPESQTTASYIVKLPVVPHIAPMAATVRSVPTVDSLSLRAAVRTLHAAGFRVELIGGTGAIRTIPAAGTAWTSGRVVKISGGQW
jgi:membrane peptidoglycan carboxypeptidase